MCVCVCVCERERSGSGAQKMRKCDYECGEILAYFSGLHVMLIRIIFSVNCISTFSLSFLPFQGSDSVIMITRGPGQIFIKSVPLYIVLFTFKILDNLVQCPIVTFTRDTKNTLFKKQLLNKKQWMYYKMQKMQQIAKLMFYKTLLDI
jgi:hypothetical protein